MKAKEKEGKFLNVEPIEDGYLITIGGKRYVARSAVELGRKITSLFGYGNPSASKGIIPTGNRRKYINYR